jgi:hypothetical protein
MKTAQILLLGVYFLSGIQSAVAGVTISSPANGATVTSPVQLAAANSGSQPTSMSEYVDNALVLEEVTTSITTQLVLASGSHTITVSAQNRNRRSSSATITITVGTGSPPPPPGSVADQIAADMLGANEGYPHGVPLSYDWANGPVIGMGNNSSGSEPSLPGVSFMLLHKAIRPRTRA